MEKKSPQAKPAAKTNVKKPVTKDVKDKPKVATKPAPGKPKAAPAKK